MVGHYVVKIATHLSTNVSANALHARYIFLTGKIMAALSELLLQMVTYFHAGSHVKPEREDMQMSAGRKEHKNNECSHSGSFCIYVGHKLIRGEVVFSLKRRRRG